MTMELDSQERSIEGSGREHEVNEKLRLTITSINRNVALGQNDTPQSSSAKARLKAGTLHEDDPAYLLGVPDDPC
jgi:hypothetical protein